MILLPGITACKTNRDELSMVKKKLTLSVDSDIIEQTKIRDINISDEVEKCLMKKLNLRKVTIEYAEECEKPCKDITKYKFIGK